MRLSVHDSISKHLFHPHHRSVLYLQILPYHPYLVGSISKILEEIYGYNFKSPPIPNYPYLSDKFIKKKFENRTKEDWKKIQKNYNSNYLIAPKSWKINLEIAITDKKFNLYQIN